MRPVIHPPDAVLRAYSDLVNHVFMYLRVRSRGGINNEELFDLADAMHNIGDLLSGYGSWVDDEKYRERYLRPFDRKWRKNSIGLEDFLRSRLEKELSP